MVLLQRQPVNAGATTARRLGLACGMLWLMLVIVILVPGLVAPVLPAPLLYLQFPYRLIGLTGMVGATGLALMITTMADGVARKTFLALFAVTVVVTALVESALPKPPRPHSHQSLLASVADQPDGLSVRYEYFPRATNPVTLAARVRAAAASLDSVSESVVRGSGTMTMALRLVADTTITLPIVAYDFVEVVDREGRTIPTAMDDGLVSLALPAGVHFIAVTRRVPGPYWVGAGVTLIGLLALLAGAASPGTWRPHRNGPTPPAPTETSRRSWLASRT
jgi:hypothetical protein